MKDRWVVQVKERRICAAYESTLSTADAVPLPHAGKAYKVSPSPVTPTIRGKESSHMRDMRSFGSVLTCSGWGFSDIERFRPLRMTIREGGRALIWEICCVFWN